MRLLKTKRLIKGMGKMRTLITFLIVCAIFTFGHLWMIYYDIGFLARIGISAIFIIGQSVLIARERKGRI